MITWITLGSGATRGGFRAGEGPFPEERGGREAVFDRRDRIVRRPESVEVWGRWEPWRRILTLGLALFGGAFDAPSVSAAGAASASLYPGEEQTFDVSLSGCRGALTFGSYTFRFVEAPPSFVRYNTDSVYFGRSFACTSGIFNPLTPYVLSTRYRLSATDTAIPGTYTVVSAFTLWSNLGSAIPGETYYLTNRITVRSRPSVFVWGGAAGEHDVPEGLGEVVGVASAGATMLVSRYHTMALRSDGTVAVWGTALNGQTEVPRDLRDVIAIAAGVEHCLALRANGTVVAWGAKGWSRGLDTNPAWVPAGLTNVVAIAAGSSSSYALRGDGTVVGWGYLTIVPPKLGKIVAIADAMALRADGVLLTWGYFSPEPMVGPSNIVAMAQGSAFRLALTREGTVLRLAAGATEWNQTNIPPGLTNLVAITAGEDHCLGLKDDGSVVRWKADAPTLLPVPTGLSNVVAIASSGTRSVALKAQDSAPGRPRLRWGIDRSTPVIWSPTKAGRTYVLETSEGFGVGAWVAGRAVLGTGAPRSFRDSTPSGHQRFYRVSER